jgi:23S rRNA (cytidine1920-2'-O)/16S rRNA (cytidine1409-2'-O)-methyltransferase
MTDGRRIDVLLVERGLFASRAKAREAIEAGLVYSAGKRIAKPSEIMAEDAEISAEAPYPWVSRGGVKLAHALDVFHIDPAGLACLDIGASTGGFTHVLIERGAREVYAVDVGHGQLHPDIASDPRVRKLEQTDIRALDADVFSGARPSLIVCDVSFISLKLVLPAAFALADNRAQLIALIKPQFEAGRDGTRKGIVRDPAVHRTICDDISAFIAGQGWTIRGLIPSPIEGGDGNREFLICAEKD